MDFASSPFSPPSSCVTAEARNAVSSSVCSKGIPVIVAASAATVSGSPAPSATVSASSGAVGGCSANDTRMRTLPPSSRTSPETRCTRSSGWSSRPFRTVRWRLRLTTSYPVPDASISTCRPETSGSGKWTSAADVRPTRTGTVRSKTEPVPPPFRTAISTWFSMKVPFPLSAPPTPAPASA